MHHLCIQVCFFLPSNIVNVRSNIIDHLLTPPTEYLSMEKWDFHLSLCASSITSVLIAVPHTPTVFSHIWCVRVRVGWRLRWVKKKKKKAERNPGSHPVPQNCTGESKRGHLLLMVQLLDLDMTITAKVRLMLQFKNSRYNTVHVSVQSHLPHTVIGQLWESKTRVKGWNFSLSPSVYQMDPLPLCHNFYGSLESFINDFYIKKDNLARTGPLTVPWN